VCSIASSVNNQSVNEGEKCRLISYRFKLFV